AGAAAVVAGAGNAVLGSLVDKSLLRVAGPGRYDLHPLVHQFTRELNERGVAAGDPQAAALPAAGGSLRDAAAAQARYFLTVAESAVQEHERGAPGALAGLRREVANLTAALRHFEQAAEHELQLRLAVTLGHYYLYCGPYKAGAEVLAAALSHSSGPPRITAIAQLLSGQIAQRRGRPEQSLPHLTAARRLAGATAQPEVRAAALTAVAGLQLQHDDDPATAESSVREAL